MEQAINEIREDGTFLEKDAEGFFVSDADASKIRFPWTEAVEFARETEVERLGECLHSLYLRGSVTRGRALMGRSDLDLFAVIRDEAAPPAPQWPAERSATFHNHFPFVTSVETSQIPLGAVHGPFHYYRFMMKISAICIHGDDLLPAIQRYSPDAPIAEEWFRVFPHLVDKFAEDIRDSTDRNRHLCHDMMKAFLRTGMLLVMRRQNGYSRDLYPSYLCFSKHYPDLEIPMRRCLELAVNPIAERDILLPLVTEFSEWMQAEAARQFGSVELLPASLVR